MGDNLKCDLCTFIKYPQLATVNVPLHKISSRVKQKKTFPFHLNNHLSFLLFLLMMILHTSRVNCDNVTSSSLDSQAVSNDASSIDFKINQSLRWESLRNAYTSQSETDKVYSLASTESATQASVDIDNLSIKTFTPYDAPWMPSSTLFDTPEYQFIPTHTVTPSSAAPDTQNTSPSLGNLQHVSTSIPKYSTPQGTNVKSNRGTTVDTVKFSSHLSTLQPHQTSKVQVNRHTSPLPIALSSPVSVNRGSKSKTMFPEKTISKSVTISMVTSSPAVSTSKSRTSISMSISSTKAPIMRPPANISSQARLNSKSKTLNSRISNRNSSSQARPSESSSLLTSASSHVASSTKPSSQLLRKIIESALTSSSAAQSKKSKPSRNATHSGRSYNEDDEIILNYHSSLPNSSLHNMYYPESSNVYDNLNGHLHPFTRVVNEEKLPPYKLMWSDEFNDSQVDQQKWMHLIDCSGRGNNELQCYTDRPDNVYTDEGVLHLQALVEEYNNRSYTSGRLHSLGPGWLYGLFEVRARLPKGKHLWPAIWMVPVQNIYGPWPRSGEIDIMEMRGQVSSSIESTVHFGASRSDRTYVGSRMIDFHTDFSSQYHIFSFEWTNTSMTWYLDGTEYYRLDLNQQFITKKGTVVYNKTGSPFDHAYRIILNVAVGGGFFPSSVYGNLYTDDALDWEKPNMQVDWVRVYQRPIGHSSADDTKKKSDLESVNNKSSEKISHTVQLIENQTITQPSTTIHLETSTLSSQVTSQSAGLNISTVTLSSSTSSLSPERPIEASTVPSTVDVSESESGSTLPMSREQSKPETSTPMIAIFSHETSQKEDKNKIVSDSLDETPININLTSSFDVQNVSSTVTVATSVTTSTLDSTVSTVNSTQATTAGEEAIVKGNDEKKINEVINYEYDSTEDKLDSPLITYYYYQEDSR